MTYEEMLRHVRTHGKWRDQRAKLSDGSQPKALTVFAPGQIQYDLREGFPLITTKYVPLKLVAAEVLWYLRGDTNIKYLNKYGCHVWDNWADEDGELGPIYGKQWRNWQGPDGAVDQIDCLIWCIKWTIKYPTSPFARRMVVFSLHPADMPDESVPTGCHTMFQCDVDEGFLNLQMYQRSADMFLGIPWNIASYALLTHILARITGLKPGVLAITLGNAHIYANHIEQVDEQLTRKVLPLPRLTILKELNSLEDAEQSTPADYVHQNYIYHPPLKGEVAV